MAVDLGKGYVQIIPSAKGISGAIAKDLSGEAGKAGKSSGLSLISSMKGIIAKAAIGTTIVAGIKKSISEGGKLEQSIGGIETLFKNNANDVINNSKTAYKRAGMSANDYMENVTSFSASLIKSVGGDTAKAAKSADMALVDMSDNANKMGTNLEDIQHAYQGFAKQNYTMLDNLKLGYGGTKSEMERLLSDAEKISGQKYDISNLNDVYKAIHVIQGDLDITGTTAKEAAGTIQGSFGMMKASFTDLMGNLALGRDIGPSVKNLVDSTITFLVGNLIPAIGRIFASLPTVITSGITSLAPYVSQGINWLMGQLTSMLNVDPASFFINIFNSSKGFGDMLAGMLDSMTANLPNMMSQLGTQISNAFKNLIPLIKLAVMGIFNGLGSSGLASSAINFATTLFNALKGAILGLIPRMGTIAVSLINGLINNFPTISTVAAQMITYMYSAITSVIDNLTSFIDSFGAEGAKAGGNIVKNFVTGIIKNLPQILMGLLRMQVSIIKGIGKIQMAVLRLLGTLAKNAFRMAISIGSSIISGIGNGLAGLASRVGSWISGALSPITNFVNRVKGLFPIHLGSIFSSIKLPHFSVSGGKAPFGIGGKGSLPKFDVKWYAKGGIVNGATIIGAGERGAEAIVPLDPFWDKLDKMNTANTYNVNMTVDAHDLDDLMTMQQFIDMIQRARAFA